MSRRWARVLALQIALAVATAMAVAAPSPALGATTFVVNRIGDAADLNLANTKCDTSPNAGNQCTLRAAIQEAYDTTIRTTGPTASRTSRS